MKFEKGVKGLGNIIHIFVIVIYLALMILLGIYFSKREVKTTEDFSW